METVTKTSVIIVGAGPTGLSLATQLLRYGIDFIIFDKKDDITTLSKALAVQARTLEIYDQLGIVQEAIKQGKIANSAALMHDGKISVRLNFSDLGKRLSAFPFPLFLEQSKNEQLLYDYLKQNGKDVWWQRELESLTQSDQGVRIVIKDAANNLETIEADYLVGCDGASSETRQLLNLNFIGSTFPRFFYVADVEMEIAVEDATLYASFGTDAFVLMMPMEGDKHWRLIGNLPEYNNLLDKEVDFAVIEAKVKEIIKLPLDITKVRWLSSYRVHTRHAERFSQGRSFLAGDAAHIHTPAGGQGMNTGIQDAYNLAWKIAFTLNGWAAPSLLETYNEERLANAKRLLRTTDQAFEIGTADHWYLRVFRDRIFPSLASFITQFDAAKEFVFPLVSQIGINYRESSLSNHQGDDDFEVKAGDRMPYFLVDGVNVHDLLRQPKAHLLIFSDGQHDNRSIRTEVETELGKLADCSVIPLYPRVVDIFGSNQPFCLILRPDNHIGVISKEISIKPLRNYLKDYLKN